MGITEVTVPKQYVIVQATQPTGSFEGQLWYDNDDDLTYIYNDGTWSQITLDISNEVLELATENAEQQIDIIELQANAGVTPLDHDTLISDTFSDSDGYKDTVNTGNTTADFNSTKYQRDNIGSDLANNLVSYWSMENDGTDDTGTNDLSDVGTPAYTTGKQGNCLDADGTAGTNYLSKGSGLLTSGSNAFSCSMWIKPTNASATTWPVADVEAFKMGIKSNKYEIQMRDTGSTWNIVNSDAVTTSTNWAHVVLTWQGTTGGSIKLYVNGSLANSGTNTTALSIGSGNAFYIGHTYFDSAYDGLIDEVAYWTRELTSDEVSDLYNSGDGLNYSGTATVPSQDSKMIEIDLPTITGTVTHTEIVTNSTIETGASITYKLNNGTTDDTEETPNTKNTYNLTGVPTKLKILLNPKDTNATTGNPSITSYALKLWKS